MKPKVAPAPDAGDEILVARIAARDASTFRALVEMHVTALHRTAYRMTGDRAEAEDIAQEALLRLWRDAGHWPPGRVIAAWLMRVAINLALDRLRRRRFASDAEIPDQADDAPLAPELIAAAEAKAATVAAIAALPDRQRAAIVLTYYEDLPNQQAAEALEMNIKAFESLLLRARAALRVALWQVLEPVT